MKKRKEQKELSSVMTRRMLMVGAGQILLGASLVGRLYQLQISQTDNYRRLSERNQFDKRLIQAPRVVFLMFMTGCWPVILKYSSCVCCPPGLRLEPMVWPSGKIVGFVQRK